MIEYQKKDNLANYFTEETVTNQKGGSQSKCRTRFDLLPPSALFKVAEVLAEGAAKYGDKNWELIPVDDHLNHALNHLFGYLGNDKTEDHLSHALCRLLFACDLYYRQLNTTKE